jgi:hypothetical protein
MCGCTAMTSSNPAMGQPISASTDPIDDHAIAAPRRGKRARRSPENQVQGYPRVMGRPCTAAITIVMIAVMTIVMIGAEMLVDAHRPRPAPDGRYLLGTPGSGRPAPMACAIAINALICATCSAWSTVSEPLSIPSTVSSTSAVRLAMNIPSFSEPSSSVQDYVRGACLLTDLARMWHGLKKTVSDAKISWVSVINWRWSR